MEIALYHMICKIMFFWMSNANVWKKVTATTTTIIIKRYLSYKFEEKSQNFDFNLEIQTKSEEKKKSKF